MTQQPLTNVNQSQLLAEYCTNPTSLFPQNSTDSEPPAHPVIVTGQQIGLLGGPLYTLLKICSARQAALDASKRLGVEVRPVFWLEDNDHDAVEASTTWVPQGDGSLSKHTLWDGGERVPVSELAYTTEHANHIQQFLETLDGRHSAETRSRLAPLYQPARKWADVFLDVLQPYLDTWNVQVVRASDLIREGAHRALVIQDLTSTALVEAITASSNRLVERGFQLQAAVGSTLFFLHIDGQRQKLYREGALFRSADDSTWSTEELLAILDAEPWRFSPNVLGRPLMQDLALPTIANVLGAAEVAYHAQLTDAYACLGRPQPHVLLRHHALLLDAKTERVLRLLDMQAAEFYTPLVDLEAHALAGDIDSVLQQLHTAGQTARLLEPFRTIAGEVDATLVKTVEGAGATIEGALDVVRGKIRTAIKRRQTEKLDRLRSAWWAIYPAATLAERVIPLAVLESRFGVQLLRIIAENIVQHDRHVFTTMGTSDVEQHS